MWLFLCWLHVYHVVYTSVVIYWCFRHLPDIPADFPSKGLWLSYWTCLRVPWMESKAQLTIYTKSDMTGTIHKATVSVPDLSKLAKKEGTCKVHVPKQCWHVHACLNQKNVLSVHGGYVFPKGVRSVPGKLARIKREARRGEPRRPRKEERQPRPITSLESPAPWTAGAQTVVNEIITRQLD